MEVNECRKREAEEKDRRLEENGRCRRQDADQQKHDLEMRAWKEREERARTEGLAGQREAVKVLGDLEVWALDEDPAGTRLFWIYGVVGCGKSAVAASSSQLLDSSSRLAESFFCRRDDEGRRHPRQLLGNFAYFLAHKHTGFREALLGSLKDPGLGVNRDAKSYFGLVFKRPLSASK